MSLCGTYLYRVLKPKRRVITNRQHENIKTDIWKLTSTHQSRLVSVPILSDGCVSATKYIWYIQIKQALYRLSCAKLEKQVFKNNLTSAFILYLFFWAHNL